MILTVSSLLVMAALTVTGVYIYNSGKVQEPQDNVVDFSALENETPEADKEIALAENNSARNLTSRQEMDGELDYDPYYIEQERILNSQEVSGSAKKAKNEDTAKEEESKQEAPAPAQTALQEESAQEQTQTDTANGPETAMRENVGYAVVEQNNVLNSSGGQEAAALPGGEEEELALGGDSAGEELALGSDSAGEKETAPTADSAGEEETAPAADSMREEAAALTDGSAGEAVAQADNSAAQAEEAAQALQAVADVGQEAANLHFSEADKLSWPIAGNILLNFSMDKTIYFPTLQQYKYNPSLVISSTQGTSVTCAADGIVTSVYKDAQTGNTVVTDLGDGYQLTYGQLDSVAVEEGDFIEAGAFLGEVAAPTKYYTAEGTNVYFKLTKDGEPVNPLDYLG